MNLPTTFYWMLGTPPRMVEAYRVIDIVTAFEEGPHALPRNLQHAVDTGILWIDTGKACVHLSRRGVVGAPGRRADMLVLDHDVESFLLLSAQLFHSAYSKSPAPYEKRYTS